MKKVTLTDLKGKEIEVYFADAKTAESATHGDQYEVKVENIPSNKSWFDMTGGAMYNPDPQSELVSEEGLGHSFYENLNKNFLNKIKCLEEPQSQINIDDTIPSDFVELGDLRNGAIYKVAGLSLVAKLVGKVAPINVKKDCLLKMKRHGTVFYVEEGALMKATELQVQSYLEESK